MGRQCIRPVVWDMWCDHPGCNEAIQSNDSGLAREGETFPSFSTNARELGWKIPRSPEGTHLCPEHATPTKETTP